MISRRPSRATTARGRRGATLVETAVVLVLFLSLVFAMLDLGLAVSRRQTLAQAARQAARQAIVHGGLAQELGPWGPGDVVVQANSSHPLATAVRPLLVGFDLNEVTLRAVWPDGGNDPLQGHRVRVSLESTYRPVFPFPMRGPINLEAQSTMTIAH